MSTAYFAPGRVNLIGEHLDYNGGKVLPAAITLGIKATVSPRSDGRISFRTAAHPYMFEEEVAGAFTYRKEQEWANYPIGVVAHLLKENFEIPSVDILYETTLPQSSGLSSSAAIEVLTAYLLLHQTHTAINHVWLANFCKQVENEFIGVQCGIMDQYAVSLGKRDHALLLDCSLVSHEYIPFELGPYRLMVMNTNKPRSLVHSKYNERRSECEEALRLLQTVNSGLHNLCDAQPHQLNVITDETLYKRAKHVVTENLRVKEAVKALRVNDLSTFGRLMNASHTSLKEDYEVSGTELDTLAQAAQGVKGCLGARMTGAGFGGCAIAIVHETSIDKFNTTVAEQYYANTGLQCSIYECHTGDGVHVL